MLRRAAAALLLLSGAGCSREEGGAPPAYVGRQACIACHAAEHAAWQGSHHDLAMQEVSEATVLGDFGDVTFTHFGEESRFYRKDGAFMVRTTGADGKPADFQVSYVFGVDPLQQYLIRFAGGRLQALSICWDARPKEAGGQRWFHLYQDERIAHDDELHWTGPNQNWNHMCAQCHSTDLRKNFDLATGTYKTTWAEIDVSCEACHGPASRHVAWAQGGAKGSDKGLLADLRNRSKWHGAATAVRVAGDGPSGQLDACAGCHSRRSAGTEDFAGHRPVHDAHRVVLLDAGLYHPDGQIEDEVYEYGSFVQSKMHRAGVTCTDCHEPHRLGLHAQGNALCARCHAAATFDVPAHHHHEPGSAGAQCVACHMPAKSYMVVDPRRDHSLRVPRPDLSDALGTPNACTGCHADKANRWAAEAIAGWAPDKPRPPHFGAALHAGRRGDPGAAAALRQLAADGSQPAIARGTALSLLQRYPGEATLGAARNCLGDGDPLVRLGALQALQPFPSDVRRALAVPLLDDPLRMVRIEAGSLLADVQPGERLAAVLREYQSFQALHEDRPWTHVNLGLLHLRRGRPDAAQRAYETAVRLDPRWLPAHANLADLFRERGDDAACERVLRDALTVLPDAAELHYAFGLTLHRRGRTPEAVQSLARAVALAPDAPHFAYGYAVALHESGEKVRAIEVLERAHRSAPRDLQILAALASFHREGGRTAEALRWARQLLALAPEDAGVQRLVRELSAPR